MVRSQRHFLVGMAALQIARASFFRKYALVSVVMSSLGKDLSVEWEFPTIRGPKLKSRPLKSYRM